MYILLVVLYATVGPPYEVVLKGDNPRPYPSYQECVKAGIQVTDWLTQDFMQVKYECKEVSP